MGNKRGRRQRQKKLSKPEQTKGRITWARVKPLFVWITAPAFIIALSAFLYNYMTGGVRIEFARPLESGYEFSASNSSPSNQLITWLRVQIAPEQPNVIYEVTRNIDVTPDHNGNPIIPGGNTVHITATAFTELDEVVVPANSKIYFRLPPLSNRSYLRVKASMVDMDYLTVPENFVLRKIESWLHTIGIGDDKKRATFLVFNDYWTPLSGKAVMDVISKACRENVDVDQPYLCK